MVTDKWWGLARSISEDNLWWAVRTLRWREAWKIALILRG